MKIPLDAMPLRGFVGAAIVVFCGIGGALAQDLAQSSSNHRTEGAQLNASWRAAVTQLEPKVIAWRRDFHEHPELSNREVRTSGIVAKHLRGLGAEVRTGIAHTGVVAILRGARPGPTIALRADMDALPVTERTSVPFASKVVTEFRGEKVGVMHACGHDAHTAILMGVAELLAKHRDQWAGQALLVFQPAEEGLGGAQKMLEDGLLDDRPAAIRPDAEARGLA